MNRVDSYAPAVDHKCYFFWCIYLYLQKLFQFKSCSTMFVFSVEHSLQSAWVNSLEYQMFAARW